MDLRLLTIVRKIARSICFAVNLRLKLKPKVHVLDIDVYSAFSVLGFLLQPFRTVNQVDFGVVIRVIDVDAY